jgi:hypothetical protein
MPDPAMSSLFSGKRVTNGRCMLKRPLENYTPPDRIS